MSTNELLEIGIRNCSVVSRPVTADPRIPCPLSQRKSIIYGRSRSPVFFPKKPLSHDALRHVEPPLGGRPVVRKYKVKPAPRRQRLVLKPKEEKTASNAVEL